MFKRLFILMAAALMFVGCTNTNEDYLYSLNVGGKGELISTEVATNGMFLVQTTNAPDNSVFGLSFSEPVFTLKDEEADEIGEWLDKWFYNNFGKKFEKKGVSYNAAVNGVVVDDAKGIKVIIHKNYSNSEEDDIADKD